jgi:Transposase DDE domain
MHATEILRRPLALALDPMHGRRRNVLLHAVQALIDGRRLTLTDLSRSWPDATFAHAPLKALDRLLSNHHLHREHGVLHRAMAAWLLPQARPVIVVDWSDLKGDGRWCLLRAAVPVGGRALTVYERIYPNARLNSPAAQREFLEALAKIVPACKRPVIISDAGFRSDWFRAVAERGWDYVGRLRNNTKICRTQGDWQPCNTLHAGATGRPEAMGAWAVVQGAPWSCFLVRLRRKAYKHDRATTLQGGKMAQKARKREREPWLLATSLSPQQASAAQVTAAYAKRMQIELAFRDLKSHRYGMGFEDSLSRAPKRLAILLLIHAMAAFAAWLLAQALKAVTVATDPLTAKASHHQRYSEQRRGVEWLRHRRKWPPELLKAVRKVAAAMPG